MGSGNYVRGNLPVGGLLSAGNGNIYECDATRGTCTFLKYKECVKEGVSVEEPRRAFSSRT